LDVARVLVVNAGSSSLKLSLLSERDQVLAERELDAPGDAAGTDADRVGYADALHAALADGLGDADAVAHRIVHGGERFHAAVRVDASVEAGLRELTELAPLHQPKSLAALDAVSAALPDVPAIACFDTAFHATLPAAASTYALPSAWRRRWRIRRYGFHGLSHAWIARRVPSLVGRDAAGLRIVSCHLGAGASLCAITGGRSVDTTMGFTPLEGLVMATRSGSVDPGLVLWLLEGNRVSSTRELGEALERESGLLGLAGSPDMRTVLARCTGGEESARVALDVYLHSLRAHIGAMAASLGGVDVVAFTGGVGEGSPEIRARAVAGLAFLGLAVDQARNAAPELDADISAQGSAARVVVVRAREDLEMARQTRELMAESV
jgi:acetate kinase